MKTTAQLIAKPVKLCSANMSTGTDVKRYLVKCLNFTIAKPTLELEPFLMVEKTVGKIAVENVFVELQCSWTSVESFVTSMCKKKQIKVECPVAKVQGSGVLARLPITEISVPESK